MRLIYPAIVTPHVEDNNYTVVIPDLPNCKGEGETLLAAIDQAADIGCEWCMWEIFDMKDLPEAQSYEEMEVEEGSYKTLLILDVGTHMDNQEDKSVRKNVTIPKWLNLYAEKKCLNFSSVLQEALIEKIQK